MLCAPNLARAERTIRSRRDALTALLALALPLSCITPPQTPASDVPPPIKPPTAAPEVMAELDAWTAAARMGIGVNIGNTLDNTTTWETGWGNPPITEDYVKALAAMGFKTIRLPVA
ncbi:MAG TPA: hypothetical protein VGM29_01385, partial [Polyangiaceae bacterium]